MILKGVELMRKIRVLLLVFVFALFLSSCDAPIREATVSSDSTVAANTVINGDEPILNTGESDAAKNDTTAPEEAETTAEAETTGVPDTSGQDETTIIPPLRIEPAVTTKEPFEIPEPSETTAHYITGSPETEPPEPETKYPVALMYHCVSEEPTTPNTALFVRPSDFEDQARAIVENGIDTLFADEFGEVENTSVILTFDDGYEDNYTYMFPILKKYNIKATVYMIAYKIDMPGYLTTEQIKEMSDSGLVQFGSHTLDHPELTRLSESDIRTQLEGSKWLISRATGKPVTTVAYPSGKYNDKVMDIASEMYEFAYTTDDDPYIGQDPMALPRYAILRGETGRSFLRFIL